MSSRGCRALRASALALGLAAAPAHAEAPTGEEAAPTGVPTGATPATVPPDEAHEDLRPSPLDVELGARVYGRSFHYTDQLENLPPLADATLPAAPMPFVHGTWYPAAHFTGSWLAHLGLTGGFELGVATRVAAADGQTTYAQEHSLWHAGLRGRLPLALGELGRLELLPTVSYAQHRVAVLEQTSFPNVDYRLLQLGAAAEWRIEQLIVGAHFDYLVVLGTGSKAGNDIDSVSWFPNANGSGIDFGGQVGWQFAPALDVLMGLDCRAYGLDFGDLDDNTATKVAGGATDRFLSAWLALRVRIPEDLASAPPAPTSAPPPGEGAPKDDFDSFD